MSPLLARSVSVRSSGFRSSYRYSTKSYGSKRTIKRSAPRATVKKTKTASKTKTLIGSNKKYSSQGKVVDRNYTPKFTNGYIAPSGSVVYYPEHDFLDYLPWIYLFSQSSPQHDHVIVAQPDGKQVQAQPEKGVDGMVIFNWALLILLALAIIGGIVWLVNKAAQE